MTATVTSVRRASPSTRVVRVRLDGGAFRYRAGQAAEIGPASAEILAPYSIASAPEDTAVDGCLEFLIRIDARGRWGEQFEPLRRGQQLRMRGPRGGFTFPDHPSERHFLFIAGGTGIVPIRAMIRRARKTVPGTFRLLYSARTPLDFAYRRELCGMARRGEIELTLTVTRDVTDKWRGERGRISAAQLSALIDTPATLCFVCGPAAMVDEVPRMLHALGIDRSRIRIEEW
ncbi:MAG: FAD-dependent oxidoreductase [Vicinamibacterales bacterium]